MKSKGFTLIELVIVIVMIGILAGLAIPNFTRLKAVVYQNRMKSNLYMIKKLQIDHLMNNDIYGPASDYNSSQYYCNCARYNPYSNSTDYIAHGEDDLGIVWQGDRRYYYIIYTYKYENHNYYWCYAIAMKFYKNDIDGDDGRDYWVINYYHEEPYAYWNDLK